MDTILKFLKEPFVWGLLLGLLFFALSFYAHVRTKMEFGRYRKHLSDKLELEARQFEVLRKEKDDLGKENEHLRIKTAQAQDLPQQKLERELEILARAERTMMINAPGFAPAWENAKSNALAELVEEERGNTLPKRIFRKFFGAGEGGKEIVAEALPEDAESAAAQPSEEASSQGA